MLIFVLKIVIIFVSCFIFSVFKIPATFFPFFCYDHIIDDFLLQFSHTFSAFVLKKRSPKKS